MATVNASERLAERRALAAWSAGMGGVIAITGALYFLAPRMIVFGIALSLATLVLLLLRFSVLTPQRLLTFAAATLPIGIRAPISESTSIETTLVVLQLAFLIVLSQRILVGGKHQRTTPLDIGVLWFVFATLASTVAAADVGIAIRKEYYLLNWAMIYFLVRWTVTDTERLRWTCRGLVFGAFMLALIGIAQFIASLLTSATAVCLAMTAIMPIFEGAAVGMRARDVFQSMFFNWKTPFGMLRVMGTHMTPMSFAQGISQFVFLPLVTLYRARASWIGKLWSIGVVVVLGVAIVLTFSRGGWLALAVGSLVYLLLNREMSFGGKIKTVAVLIGIVLAAAVVIWFVAPSLYESLSRLTGSIYDQSGKADSYTSSNSTRIRSQMWGWEMFAAHPVLGVGPDNFGPTLGLSTMASAHSFYAQSAAELGGAGLLGYLAIIILALHAALRASRKARDPELRLYAFALFAGFLTVCVHSGFQSYGYTPKVAIGWWIVVGLCGALSAMMKAECPVVEQQS